MTFFKKNPTLLAKKPKGAPDCCGTGDGGGCCDLITSFTYDENTYILTLTTAYGSVFPVDLSSLAPDGVVNSVTYDPVTDILTITTTVPTTYTVQLSGSVVIANSLFVMENGSDVTGTRERMDLPYATPWAAVAAAQVGDTIFVYPGTYTNANFFSTDYLAKDGVTIHMFKGSTIEYGGSPNTVRPLWDQGVAINFSIRGEGVLNMNWTASTSVANLMSAASTYYFELDEFNLQARLFSTAGTSFTVKARKVLITQYASFISWRNTVQTTSEFKLYCEEFNHGSAVQVLTPIDIRNFDALSVTDIDIRHFKASTVFSTTGNFYFVNCQGTINVEVGKQTQNSANTGYVPIGIFITTSANFNINLKNISHTGTPWIFLSTYTGGLPSNGKLYIEGKFTTVAVGAATTVFGAGSRVNIEYDVEVVNDFTAYMWDFTATPETVHFGGKIRYSTTIDPATAAPFRNNNVGGLAATSATLRDLVVETNTDYLFISAGPTQADINCMSVYANVGLDPVLHAAVIEPITVSPAVTV